MVAVSAVAASVLSWPGQLDAAWIRNRDRPSLRHITAIDRTGESGWPYGSEDIAGDGLSSFAQAERRRDVRTAYAATDNDRLWLRLYVSDQSAPPADLVAYLFVDADRNPVTGGRATGAEVDASLSADPTPGGYEYVVSFRADGSLTKLWIWQSAPGLYQSQTVNMADTAIETGADTDPIRIFGDVHGYLQFALRQSMLGITGICGAHLFLRTLNASADAAGEDVDVGSISACVPADNNQDRVPDVVVTAACRLNEHCPAGGLCVSGRCVVAAPCLDDADCSAEAACSSMEWCVARPAGSCSSNANCSDLVCRAGRCEACSVGGNECGPGLLCAPDGRCISSLGPVNEPVALAPGEKVEGGAFHCAVSSPKASAYRLSLAAVGLGLLWLRRLRRRRSAAATHGGRRE